MSYNEWLDIDVLEDYLDGKLDAQAMHKVEKLSLEDPFVAEALAGLSQSPKRALSLSLLQKQLQQRVAQKPITEKRWRITSQRLSIAAAAAVLFVTVSILFWMKESNRQQMASQNKKVEVNISAPAVAEKAASTPSITAPTIEKEPAPTAENRKNQTAKAKSFAAITDKLPKVAVAEAPVSNAAPKTDSVHVALAGNVAKEAERKERAAIIQAQQALTVASKKAEVVRERPLPGKVEGIYVESNSNMGAQPAIVNGKVYAKTDGQPLPGAVVRIAGTNKATTTNNKGEFTLPIDSLSQNLSIAYLGYSSQEVKTPANKTVNIALEENKNALNEVAVIANSSVKESSNDAVSLPSYAALSAYFPLGGWQNYLAYLSNNNNLAKKDLVGKEVTLKFEVKANGAPTKIVVEKSQGKRYDAEALRLLKDGPKWLPVDPNKKGTARIVVKF